jgi:hypothetical protein
MTFWNVSGKKALQPKRNYRFKFRDGNENAWWWAKTVDKPSFDVSSNEYQLINHKFKYPGIATWKPILLTVVDVGLTIDSLYKELLSMGYQDPSEGAMTGLAKDYKGLLNRVTIEQLEGTAGVVVEEWTLYGAFITSLSMSKLDYSNDDLSEITVEISYDYAKLRNINQIGQDEGAAAADAAIGSFFDNFD